MSREYSDAQVELSYIASIEARVQALNQADQLADAIAVLEKHLQAHRERMEALTS